MFKHLLIGILIALSCNVNAQTQVDSLNVKKVLKVNGKRILKISNDSALLSKDSNAIITDYAAKSLIKPETDPIWQADKPNYPTTSSIQATYPPFSGAGAYGTWNINILGNANSVTNGLYSTGSYSNPSWLNSLSYYKLIDTPSVLSRFTNDVGYITSGYSGFANINGANANGTWPISITGNAASVTNGLYSTGSYSNPSWLNSLSYYKLIDTPSVLSRFTNDVGYITGSYTGFDTRYQPLGTTNLSSGVSGVLGVSNGGTGQTTLAGVQSWLGLGTAAYRNANQDLNTNSNVYFNTMNVIGGGSSNNGSSVFWTDIGDGWLKKSTVSDVRSILGLGSNAYTSTSYLPLTGGSLTGVLTSNSDISTTTNFNAGSTGYISQLLGGSANNGVQVNVSSNTTKWGVGSNQGFQSVINNRNLNFNYFDSTSWHNYMYITPAGDATFNGNVNVNSNTFNLFNASTNSSIFSNYNNSNIVRLVAASNGNGYVGVSAGPGSLSIGVTSNPNALLIDNTGVSTFSSSVTGASFIKSGGTSSQFLKADGSVDANAYLTSTTGVTSIIGTANQVIASASTGAVTLSLPQSIATTSTPTFVGQTLTGPLNGTTASFSGDLSTQTQYNAGSTGYVAQLLGGFANNAVLVNANNDGTQWSIGSDVGLNNVASNRNLNFKYRNGTSWIGYLNINTSGAATFSSSVTASAFFNASDKRLKNILSRKGDMVTYRWKDGRDKLLHYGYIAQEVQKKMPNQIMKDNNGYLSVNYTEVHTKKINDLENEVAELKQQINELKNIIKALQQ